MSFCSICGNEIESGSAVCRFCGSRQEKTADGGRDRTFVHRTINLEKGMPFVEQAMSQLRIALAEARALRIQALTIIHGYGSSGRGGAIRNECRKILDHMCSRGEVNSYIAGEDFHRRNGRVRDLLKRYPQLAANANLNGHNRGITLVIL